MSGSSKVVAGIIALAMVAGVASAQTRWIAVGQDPRSTTYADVQDVSLVNGQPQIWIKSLYYHHKMPPWGQPFDEVMTDERANCRTGFIRFLEIIYRNRSDNSSHTIVGGLGGSYAAPGTLGSQVFKIVCRDR